MTRVRLIALLGFLISLSALAGALYLQTEKEWLPCPLCVMSRYAFFASALFFVGLGFSKRNGVVSKTLALGCLTALVFGLTVSGYHLWVLSNPMQTCGVDPLQLKLNALPWVNLWPEMFVSDGLCSEGYPPLFGLSLPAWAAVAFVAQAVCLFVSEKYRRLSVV